ncbi:MAG: hypothetical protein RRY34_05310, partial [Victivallaceae bacterium]
EAQKDWNLILNAGSADSYEKRRTNTAEVNSAYTSTLEYVAPSGNVLKKTITEMQRTRVGLLPVETYNGEKSYGLKTAYSYNTTSTAANTLGAYGKIHIKTSPLGMRTVYSYDAAGRVEREFEGWLNTTAWGSAGDPIKVTYYTYASNSTDPRPRNVIKRIVGVTVSNDLYDYGVDSATGEYYEVHEKGASYSAVIGSSGNLRTEKRYYAPSDIVQGGLLKSVTYPDNRKVTYEYSFGNFVPGAEFGNYTFTVDNTNGAAFRTITTEGTVNNPDGVANHTTRSVTISNAVGDAVVNEEYIYTGSGYEKINWTERRFNNEHKELASCDSLGRLRETTWNCCNRTSFKDWDGTEYTYEYDNAKRLTAENKLDLSGNVTLRTEYTYDAMGRKLSTKVKSGTLSLTSSQSYDLASRIVSRTNEKGEVSTIVYSSDGGLTVTETLYNGATLITKKYRDGQIDSEYGTGRVPTYYNYGTDSAKGYFTYTANSAGGANYTRTFYDIFGRISRVEKPGMNSTMLSSERTYNALSQLIKSTTPGMASTLYEYNDLGELLRSGLDVDNNGTLDLASSDRIQESEHSFVKLDNSWYDESKSLVYGTAGSGTATLISTQRNKLTNLAAGVASESVSIDRYGNETTSRVEFNRAGKQVKNITVYPNSPIAAESTTINGLQTSVRDQLNQITTYTYDGLERPLTITDSRGNTQSVSYHTTGVGQIGDVATITDAANNTTSFTTSFNGVNKIKATTNAQGKISYNAYNAMGLVYRIWGATDYPIQLTYDSFGRQTELRTFRAGTPAIWAGANFP